MSAAPSFVPFPSEVATSAVSNGGRHNFHQFSSPDDLASTRGPAQTPAISLAFAAATDIGCVRANNEDSFGYDAERQLYVVCDGMGGAAGGEVASSMAVRVLIESFEAQAVQAKIDQVRLPTEERLSRSVFEVNRAVREAAAGNPELHSMGTTLVCACLDG